MAEVYEKYRGFNIFVEQDDHGGDGPRDWDNLGTMVCFHRSYILGDTGGPPKWRERKNRAGDTIPSKFPTFETFQDFCDWQQEEASEGKMYLVLGLKLYDHSGIWMNTVTERWWWHAGWDSMQVGWIYVSYLDIDHEYGEVNDDTIARTTKCLLGEVEAYSQFISGQVYGYVVKDRNGEWLDSCWGYYGHDFKTNGLLETAHSYIDWHLAKAYKDRARQVMAWIREGVPHIYRTPMRI